MALQVQDWVVYSEEKRNPQQVGRYARKCYW